MQIASWESSAGPCLSEVTGQLVLPHATDHVERVEHIEHVQRVILRCEATTANFQRFPSDITSQTEWRQAPTYERLLIQVMSAIYVWIEAKIEAVS